MGFVDTVTTVDTTVLFHMLKNVHYVYLHIKKELQ